MNNNFNSFLKRHINKYPNALVNDFLKLIYQAEFGVKHLIRDISSFKNEILNEINTSNNKNELLYEYISSEFVRVNLSSFKESLLDLSNLIDLFLLTSKLNLNNNTLSYKLNILKQYFSTPLIDAFKENPSLQRHSDIYKKYYNPHYLVINSDFLPLEYKIKKINNYINTITNDNNKPYFIALEGKCASGKTTICKYIENATVIHADDFFSNSLLPLDFDLIRKTLSSLKVNQKAVYQTYNCMNNTYITKEIPLVKNIVILEGVFSYHEKIRDIFDDLIYINSPANQVERLKIRCGSNETLYNKFINTWIPRENKYYNSFDFIENASIII